ncbi:MAG: PQQ-dependent sugar dehydrogenase [Gaiella sp.]|nr:PQQ-dependent sugar dehydrogenase [Gaiella sp.]
MKSSRGLFRIGLAALALAIAGAIFAWKTARASYDHLPTGFRDVVVLSGMSLPVSFEIAADGRVFVAEQRGRILVFDDLRDSTPTVFADLSTRVHSWSERGLLDIALDPRSPDEPAVYALYTHDARIGGTAPLWGKPGDQSDTCPGPEQGTLYGCVASGRLSRLTTGPDGAVSENVLIEDWCIQFNTHTIGSLVFAPDGALYVSAGDGADWRQTDYGQLGRPPNPCGDPPLPPGRAASPDVAEGGSLRAQSVLRSAGQPVTLDGTVIRIDPDTGAALPDNPYASDPDPNRRRVVAFGFKNPFRMTLDPSGRALWIGDVGHDTWEEINRLPLALPEALNFGWPCYEGRRRQNNYNRPGAFGHVGFQIATTGRCRSLYDQGDEAVEPPYWAYRHYFAVVPGDGCARTGGAISGLTFYEGTQYPSEYHGALFFSDFTAQCIWVLPAGEDGLPDPTSRRRFVWQAGTPVELRSGSDGDLLYLDFVTGELHQIVYRPGL